ncbi:MAG: pyruvate kinase [Clostridia bacterium]|nr:pyruvate kinase [Clostridia bacterium]
MRKTKIVCTLGPATEDRALVREMILSGMDVARMNFSHNTHEDHKHRIDMIKELRQELQRPVALLLDTKGPEIRLRNFKGGKVTVEKDSTFTLTTRSVEGTADEVSVTYSKLPDEVKAGDRILIDDGKIHLQVKTVTDTDIVCRVIHGGTLSNHKSINIPNISLSIPYLSEQDKEDLLFGIEQDVDFVAASFTRCKEDVIALRKFLDYHGGHDIRIIAKIENTEGVNNFDEILSHSDGIMVARGDMGVEIEYERLPGLQKRFIRRCYQSGKMVITATQMLESMVTNPTPTRAEITDVANAVFDGTSAVMLSGETAAGNHPLKAVRVMAKIAEQAEEDAGLMDAYQGIRYDMDASDTTNAVCDAACTTARDIKAKAIIALTKYGQTARRMSKFRPGVAIVAATPVEKTFHQLALSWGVYPVLARYQKTSDELFTHAIDCAKQIDAVEDGDHVVIVAGIPLDTSGSTNLLKVEIVGNKR